MSSETKLSTEWKDRKPSYDFVVVGSGYGGAITAARLASANPQNKASVCILERGREWSPGEFPDTLPKYLDAIRSVANPLGLYDLLDYRDISVIKGSGLGGTSLVNANVALVPDEDVFALTGWPRSLTRQALMPYYERARAVLKPSRHPRFNEMKKLNALKSRARELNARVEELEIAVNFNKVDDNGFGVPQAACTDCGDCVTGCNVGSKNTLYMNYLPMARRAGAEIFTQTKVEWIEKLSSGGWRVHGTRYKNRQSKEKFTFEARNVILSAGAINSTEILLRSEMRGLRVSPRLGSGFSGNGDFFAISYNGNEPLQVLGFGNHPESLGSQNPPGPTIIGVLRYNSSRPALERFIVQDVSFPTALFRSAQLAFAAFRGEDTDAGDEAGERRRVLRDLGQKEPYAQEGALNHTLLYLVTAFDSARGNMVFEAPFWEPDGRMKIEWNDVGRERGFAVINEELRRHARANGATFVENPVWTAFNLRRLITAHPLGGCPIGEDYMHGAVDEYGRVFSGDGSVHDGLFVADGSLLPSALGVNPFLTISALSERIAERKIEEMNGQPYPQSNVAVSMSIVNPMDWIDASDFELERLFRRSTSLGIEHVVNTGERRIDAERRHIFNDAEWKGFLPKGFYLTELAAGLFTGYTKYFQRDGDQYIGATRYLDGRLPVRQSLEEVTLTQRVNDLDPGRYLVLRYIDPPFDIFYDVMKVIGENVIVYRGYTGTFPHGVRGFNGLLLRSYSFDEMTVSDHQEIFRQSAVPTKEDLHGHWRMELIANANHARGVAWLRFDLKPDGRLESGYQAMGLMEGLVTPSFAQEHFRLDDFTGFHDEIRKIDGDLLIGKWITDLPEGFEQALPTGSVSLFHVEEHEGRRRFGFYYLLRRAAPRDVPGNTLLDPLLDMRLPKGIGMSFEEEMVGWHFPGAKTSVSGRKGDLEIKDRIPPGDARPAGAAEFRFNLTILVRDLDEFIEGAEHEARLRGSVTFEDFEGGGRQVLPVDETHSRFHYLRVNPDTGEAEMRYHLEFQTGDSRSFVFEGRKYMQKDAAPGPRSIPELVEDYTTLFVHVYERKARTTEERGTAWMRFRTFEDLAAVSNLIGFLRSFRITGTDDIRMQTQARMKFLAFTGQFVQREYDPLAPPSVFRAGA